MTRAVPSRVAIGDPIVIDGHKWRVRRIGGAQDEFRAAVALAPRRNPHALLWCPDAYPIWDKRAGLWRVQGEAVMVRL